MYAAHAKLAAKFFDPEISIGNSFLYDFYRLLNELFIQGRDLDVTGLDINSLTKLLM